jgi:hypothetical protein
VATRSPAELATAIDRLLRDRALASSMGVAGLATAREHGTDALAAATLEAYEAVLGRASVRVS